MKKILFPLAAACITVLSACTDKNHNGDPDYQDNRKENTEAEDDFDRTTRGSSAGTITDANDADRTDATHHPTEGAAITASPSNEIDSIQPLPK